MAAEIPHSDFIQQGNPFERLEKALQTVDQYTEQLTGDITELKTKLEGLRFEGAESGDQLKQLTVIEKELSGKTKSLTQLQTTRQKLERERIKTQQQQIRLSQQQEKLAAKKERQMRDETSAYKKLAKAASEATRNFQDLAAKYGVSSTEAATAQKRALALNTALEKIDESVGRNQRKVGRYNDALKGTQAAFVKVTAAAAAGAGAIAAFKAFDAAVINTTRIQTQIRGQFNATGVEIDSLTASTKLLTNLLDADYKEVLQAANAVQKELQVSGTTAFDLIERAALRGANSTDELLSITKEYSAQAAAAGLTAEEFLAIVTTSINQGIYSDKGIDAIKEGGLRLRENTKAVQDALDPLDESIRLQIAQEIAAGNSFKAIQFVSQALDEASLTASQTQAIIADVFGGAGEDAGIRYLMSLKDVNTELGKIPTQIDEFEQSTINLTTAWDTFITSITNGESSVSQFFIAAKDFAAEYINTLREGTTAVSTFSEKAGMAAAREDVEGFLKDLSRSTSEIIKENTKLIETLEATISVTSESEEAYTQLTTAVQDLKKVNSGLADQEKLTDEQKQSSIRNRIAEVQQNLNANLAEKESLDKLAESWSAIGEAQEEGKGLLGEEYQLVTGLIARQRTEVELLNSELLRLNDTKTEALDVQEIVRLSVPALASLQEGISSIANETNENLDKLSTRVKKVFTEQKTLLESLSSAYLGVSLSQEEINSGLNTFETTSTQTFQSVANVFEASQNRQLKIQEDRLSSGAINEAEYATEVESIEREAFERNKQLATAEAAIRGSLAVLRIAADVPKVDFGIATGVLIAAQVALTATEIAAIQSAQFGDGGTIVDSSVSRIKSGTHVSGNDMSVIGVNKDGSKQMLGRVEGREMMQVYSAKEASSIADGVFPDSAFEKLGAYPASYRQRGASNFGLLSTELQRQNSVLGSIKRSIDKQPGAVVVADGVAYLVSNNGRTIVQHSE